MSAEVAVSATIDSQAIVPGVDTPLVIPETKRKAATSVRRLLTELDILAAVDWLLSGIPAIDISVLAEVLHPFANDFSEARPEVAAILNDLHFPGNRRSSWTTACAVLAQDARQRNDQGIFWAAGLEVLNAFKQSQRGSHHNRKTWASDSLDASIAEYLRDFPNASASRVFDALAEIAWLYHPVVIEHDQDKDELVCQLDAGSEALTNVGREEIARRVRRATGCM